jgi:hypothetical protein
MMTQDNRSNNFTDNRSNLNSFKDHPPSEFDMIEVGDIFDENRLLG